MTILPNITTTDERYEQKLQEIEHRGITEVAFFPTFLNFEDRQEFYKSLENSCVQNIPIVHLRDDMHPEELSYLQKTFNTKRFNIHSKKQHIPKYDLSDFKDSIYIENHYDVDISPEEMEKANGLCLDVSHLEHSRLHFPDFYEYYLDLLKKHEIGFVHVSAIRDNLAEHDFKDLSEFDYLIGYKEYLDNYLALELENPVSEQLQVKEYINKILS